MDDKNTDILSRYGLKPIKTGRQKGAIMVQTAQGMYLLREFDGNVRHLEFEEKLLNGIAAADSIHVDCIVRTLNGDLICEEDGGKKYIVRKWFPAIDCDVKNPNHIFRAARALAKLHKIMNSLDHIQTAEEGVQVQEEACEKLLLEFDKHNKELKRTRNFIRGKRRQNRFEAMVLQDFEIFYEDARQVFSEMSGASMQAFVTEEMKAGRLVHGSFNYHNILWEEAGRGARPFITNFERARRSLQIRDLYDFLRKVMEKHAWEQKLGNGVLNEYAQIRPVSDEEWVYLALKLKYPEKYWKLLNHYYNNNKAWVPDKDIVKLETVIRQRAVRVAFTHSMGVL